MFIAVYLIRPQRFLVIRENWAQDLLNAKLKNNGRNANQNFLIFWSANDGVANLNVQPNFDAPLSSHYEDTIHEICYLGRIIKFFGETKNILISRNMIDFRFIFDLDTYVEYAGKRRPKEPPIYNEARVNERPLPIIEPLHSEEIQNISLIENHDIAQPLPGGFDLALTDNNEQPTSSRSNGRPNAEATVADADVSDVFEPYEEPIINVPTTSDISPSQSVDPLAMIIKEELEPTHEEDIQDAADDLIREEIEFERINDDVSISVEGKIQFTTQKR